MKKANLFYLMNLIVPLMAGMIAYYLFEPNVIFVKMVDELLKLNFHIDMPSIAPIVIMRNYIFDILWGYSLVFVLVFIVGSKEAKLLISISIAVALSIMMEALQISSIIPGTFDIIDILVEIVSEVIAGYIIKNYFGGMKK